MNKEELMIELEKIKYKHSIAQKVALAVVGDGADDIPAIVNFSFALASKMTKRLSEDIDALPIRVDRELETQTKPENDFDPIQHFMDSLMSSIAKQKGQVQ